VAAAGDDAVERDDHDDRAALDDGGLATGEPAADTGAGDDAQHGAACVHHGVLDHDPDHDHTDDRVHDHQQRQQHGLDGTAGSSRSPTPTSERPPGVIRSPTTSTGPSSRSLGTSARFWRARWRR
jgi:hypothetical protein